MCTRLKLGFHPFQISKGVLGIAFDGTLFKLYIAVFKALLQKFKGRLKLLIILLTMSTSVLFLFFATPFYCGVPDIVYCAIKPSSFINFQMDLAFVLFLCTPSIIFSTLHPDQTLQFWFFPFLSLYLCFIILKSINCFFFIIQKIKIHVSWMVIY